MWREPTGPQTQMSTGLGMGCHSGMLTSPIGRAIRQFPVQGLRALAPEMIALVLKLLKDPLRKIGDFCAQRAAWIDRRALNRRPRSMLRPLPRARLTNRAYHRPR